MIDCHCHLLPNIDDGAHDIEMMTQMARAAAASGTRAIICTPHHLNGVYENPARSIRAALSTAREQLAANGIPICLYSGSELHLVPELPDRLFDGTALTYNDRGAAALIELPKATIPLGAEAILEQLVYRNITPVLAHPERNAVLAAHPERIGEWIALGCKVQLTAQSCSGAFGRRLRLVCRRWLELGWVHLIASDAHRPSGRSPATLAAGRNAVAAWLDEDAATLLTETNPQHLLSGEPLLDLPPRQTARGETAGSVWSRVLRLRR